MALTFIPNHVSLRSHHAGIGSSPLGIYPLRSMKLEYTSMKRSTVSVISLRADNSSTLSKMTTTVDKKVTEGVTLEKRVSTAIADCWREIHGENDWVRLLDPMDTLLRTELIRYGEMAQASYDAFDFDPYSKYCGSCKYSKERFFESLDMGGHGYEVSRYLYATSNINLPNFFKKPRWPKVWSKNGNWIGYVAVSNDETSKHLGRRDITIAWRGTVTRLEWISDLTDILKPVSSDRIPCHDQSIRVESGFINLYTDKDESCKYCNLSAREQVLDEVARLMEKYKDEDISITITGHSLGSALATLNAYDIAETGLHIRGDGQAVPIAVFSFSGPRVGNIRFKERLEGLGIKVLRVVNVHDVVPKTPGFILNEHAPQGLTKITERFQWSYFHVGEELALDHKNSPFLSHNDDPVCAHNLEALLHLLDGYQGKGRRFAPATGRDIALVNKDCDFLEDRYEIPPCWRQVKNKGMVKGKDGRWMQSIRPELHDDQPEDMQHDLKQ